ncbi:hypothetical protein REV95_002367 [Klebsiella pneumoniae]|nr:hypothetical protein [Klebsiella pneumoniae]
MGSCAAPSAKGDDKFITTDYLQQCRVMASTLPVVANLVLGFIIGAVVLAGVKAVSSLRGAGK